MQNHSNGVGHEPYSESKLPSPRSESEQKHAETDEDEESVDPCQIMTAEDFTEGMKVRLRHAIGALTVEMAGVGEVKAFTQIGFNRYATPGEKEKKVAVQWATGLWRPMDAKDLKRADADTSGCKYQMSEDRRNISPKVFGKHFWSMIHLASISLPDGKVTEAEATGLKKLMLDVLPALLPCHNCRSHLHTNVEDWKNEHPDFWTTGAKFRQATVDLHNLVNRQICENQGDRTKCFPDWTVEQMIEHFAPEGTTCDMTCSGKAPAKEPDTLITKKSRAMWAARFLSRLMVKYQNSHFEKGQEVSIMKWHSGVIKEVLADGKYVIAFDDTPDQTAEKDANEIRALKGDLDYSMFRNRTAHKMAQFRDAVSGKKQASPTPDGASTPKAASQTSDKASVPKDAPTPRGVSQEDSEFHELQRVLMD